VKTACVLGAFSFIGYAIVEELLRQDKQVYGYHPNKESLTKMEEEKLFQIGRNANFMYVDSLEEVNDVDVTYGCLYEPSKPLAENELITIKELMSHYSSERLVVISTLLTHREEFSRFVELEEYVKHEITVPHTIVKVPTVYGPWQPSYMTYHRLVEGRSFEESLYELEGDSDALYIDDVAKAIIEVEEEGVLYLSSSQEGEWEKGIYLLAEQENFRIEKQENMVTDVAKQVVKQSLSIEAGLQKQREHINKFQYLFKE
jgi:nucleoside-diphosphate-sugar epimerase